MRSDDFVDIANDLMRLRAAVESGGGADMAAIIEERLMFLNAHIDAMDTEKSTRDWEIIAMAYWFYRMSERIT